MNNQENKMENNVLSAISPINVRFSEVDSMNVVWHGNYAMYFEDAREEFGRKYGLSYMLIHGHGYFAPLVDLSFSYKRPLLYGMKSEIAIFYRPTDSAKLVFDYEIRDPETSEIFVTGHSVQVFMNEQYQLSWVNPDFFEQWKKRWGIEQ